MSNYQVIVTTIIIVVIGSSIASGSFMIVIMIFNHLLNCCKMVMTVSGIRGMFN